MLTLILGRAGGGKTSYIFSEIAENVKKEYKTVLLVPEQYSHDAERSLAGQCGDRACLYAEVLGFSRLCNRVFAETGGLAVKNLDKAGSILAMSLALSSLAANLKVYNVGERGPEFLNSLVEAYEELKASGASVSSLAEASEKIGGAFGEKLNDLALIFSVYESFKTRSGCDSTDRIERLAESIGESSVCSAKIFIDGFTDFTAQQLKVVSELVRNGADITVCLNTPSHTETDSIFELPAKTARRLISIAAEYGKECEIIHLTPKTDNKAPAIRHIEQRLFDYDHAAFEGDASAVEVYFAEDIYKECSFAAAKALQLVREGYRYRDIVIAAPDWGKYAVCAEEVFRKYGVSVDNVQRRDILERPVMLFVLSAFDIITNNWAYIDVFRYIKTGFAGTSHDECDLLENYVLKWNIRGYKMWSCDESWDMNPRGYSAELTEKDEEELDTINRLRRQISEPLARLQNELKDREDALGKVRAVYNFLTDVSLGQKLVDKASYLEENGNHKLADEYEQMWNILIRAMQQFADVMNDAPVSLDDFSRLMKLVLSQYDIGTIPASVDNVRVGELSRVRGRDVKCLIVMGATNTAMPSLQGKKGVFSDDEREELNAFGIEISGSGDDRVSREMGSIYSSLTLPSDKLFISYTKGGAERRSYIVSRVMDILGINEKAVGDDVCTEALVPCFEYAVSGDSAEAKAAMQYFSSLPQWKEKAETVKRAANMPKGRLSRLTAEKLYGKNINVSASRVDKYYSCRFSYFLQYGLKAQPRKTAELDAPETGTLMHYVLENVVRDVENLGGFAVVEDKELKSITLKYVNKYANTNLGGFKDKSGRFKYLFKRLSDDIWRIVRAMAEELKDSDFKPIDFELEFSRSGDMPPAEIVTDSGAVRVNGFVDRVDGWIHDDKLYVRVVDYKTGKKEFNLSDIWYGRGLQMLIYLFILQKNGAERYGKSIVPAGVLYTPARDIIISAPHDMEDDELEKKRIDKIKRSGLLLRDPEVLDAMEHRDGPSYLPVKFTKDGAATGDSLVTLEQLGKLSKHVDELLKDMGQEIREGSISADPYFRSQFDNACVYCDYFEACHFSDGAGEKRRYLSKLKTQEVWEKMGVEK